MGKDVMISCTLRHVVFYSINEENEQIEPTSCTTRRGKGEQMET